MPYVQCTQCSASVPGKAQFCPRCGRAMAELESRVAGVSAKSTSVNRVPGALPSTSPMPLAGILFLAAAVLGPTMIAVGVSAGIPLLLIAGVAVAVLLIALLLVGMVF
jgi:hypothetical protein